MKLVAAAVLLVPMLAQADVRVAAYDGPPGTVPVDDAPLPPPPVAAPQTPPIELQVDRVLASRGLLVGTALTVPEGHVEVAGRALLPVGALGSVAAGLTSSTEVYADYGRLLDFAEDDEVSDNKVYGFGVKQVLAKRATWQVSIAASMHKLNRSDLYSGTVAASTCSNEDCSTLLTISGGVMTEDHDSVPVFSASIMTGGDIAKATAEAMWLGEGGLGVLGLRLGGSSVAVDLGVALLLADREIVPLPILGLAARI